MVYKWIEVLQVLSALGLINVWIIRSGVTTPYRGGDAKTLRDEFITYGLPTWIFYTVGFLKIAAAVALVVGIWKTQLIVPASGIVCVLMVGALAMHFKVKDSVIKSLPALGMLLINATILTASFDNIRVLALN